MAETIVACRNHGPSEVVSWTGSFTARRPVLGVNLHWSYAPAEVKVLYSVDGGNFEDAVGWRRTARSEPSFEETVMFPAPVSAKAVKVLMRGPKPWGYFGLSVAAAVSGPYSFMLVSGVPATHEQCVVSSPASLMAEPCVDAIVAGDGREVFAITSAGALQTVSGACLRLVAGKLELGGCEEGAWEVSAAGQVKQGNMCLAVEGAAVRAMDCEEAVSIGAGSFFQVAVPEYDPTAAVAVQSLGKLLEASVARQQKLVRALQGALPKLSTCKAKISLANLPRHGVPSGAEPASFAALRTLRGAKDGLAAKVGAHFGVTPGELGSVVAASAEVLDAVRKASG